MADPISDPNYLDQLQNIANNPRDAVRMLLTRMESVGGTALTAVDPTNPFLNLAEFAAAEGANLLSSMIPMERRLYPSAAISPSDLYLHMSDEELVGVYALPGKSTWVYAISLTEVLAKAVQIPGGLYRKLTIPRNTEFGISDFTFGIYYPIDILVNAQGGVQVKYDASITSPLQTLQSNVLTWSVRKLNGSKYIVIEIPVEQFTMVSYRSPADLSTGFDKTFAFTDRYYYTQVYQRNSSSEAWEEISTTLTDRAYDPLKVTAVLQVTANGLRVYIPQAYFNSGLVKSNIRVDIFTTLGDTDIDVGEFNIGDYTASWRDVAADATSAYTAPLIVINDALLYANGVSTGGAAPVGFTTLRERVISNSKGKSTLPITPNQLDNLATINGFSLTKQLDTVTRREYWASQALPAPDSDDGVAPATCTVESLRSPLSALVGLSTVGYHVDRLTVYPNTLYTLINGQLALADASVLPLIEGMTVDDKVAYLNTANLFYSPFYYVLDTTGQRFSTRAYSLDFPEAKNINFVEENSTTQLGLSTLSYALRREDPTTTEAMGFYLDVVASPNDIAGVLDLATNPIKAQLSFVPSALGYRVFITETPIGNATNSDGNYVFSFFLGSTLDVDAQDKLAITTFLYQTTDQRDFSLGLDTTLDLVYMVENWHPADQQTSMIDAIIGTDFVNDPIGISHETLLFHFGDRLDTLWTRSRTVKVNVEYEVWDADVPATYPADVYELDPVTGRRAFTVDTSVTPYVIHYTKLHNAGDPTGELLHHAGDPKLDSNGDPIPVEGPYDLERIWDIALLDARYYFATSLTTTAYRDSLISTMLGWMLDDIRDIQRRALDNTFVYFYPTRTSGTVKGVGDNGSQVNLAAEQRLTIKTIFSTENYQNAQLVASVNQKEVETVRDQFNSSVVDKSGIIEQARTVLGNDVLGIDIAGLFGGSDIAVVTITDGARHFSIAKTAIVLHDGTIAVQDDVTFINMQHSA